MEGDRRPGKDTLAMEEFGEYTDEVKGKIEHRERKALKKKVESEQHLEMYGKLKEQIEMKAYRDGPMDYAKSLKLQLRVGDLDLPERRKRYNSSRKEEEEDGQACACGNSEESRTHIP